MYEKFSLFFSRYNGQVSQPSGTLHESPTESYLNQINNITVNNTNGYVNNSNGYSNGHEHGNLKSLPLKKIYKFKFNNNDNKRFEAKYENDT
jgi:hypothetical protein